MNFDIDYMEEYNKSKTIDVYGFIESYEDDIDDWGYND